ncbi:hypothetical protein BN1723_012495, partial [Verticillium longisporum]
MEDTPQQSLPLIRATTQTQPTAADVRSIPGFSTSQSPHKSDDIPHNVVAPPRPGFWDQFPVLPALSLLANLALVAAMVVIVTLADGSRVASWKVSPTVLLAVVLVLVNLLTTYIFSEGAAIRWWVLAMHRKTTVGDLHWRWIASQGPTTAFLSIVFRGWSKAAVACFAVTITTMNSPLSQRALNVGTKLTARAVTLGSLQACVQLPTEFSATKTDRTGLLSALSPDFSIVMRGYLGRTAIKTDHGLLENGTYVGLLEAAGYSFDCHESEERLENFTETGVDRYTSSYTGIFTSSFRYSERFGKSVLETVSVPWPNEWYDRREKEGRVFIYQGVWKPDFGCITSTTGVTLKRRQCDLRPAVVRYPIVIRNYTLELNPSSSYKDDEVVSAQGLDDTGTSAGSTHGGMHRHGAE